MKNKTKENLKQILWGTGTALGLWIFGQLLSGRLTFVEDIQLYPMGPLVFIFPFVMCGVHVLVARYAKKENRHTYFMTTLICSLIPLVSMFVFSVAFMNRHWQGYEDGFINVIIEVLNVVVMLTSVPAMCTWFQMMEIVSSEWVGLIYIIPVITGISEAIWLFRSLKPLSLHEDDDSQLCEAVDLSYDNIKDFCVIAWGICGGTLGLLGVTSLLGMVGYGLVEQLFELLMAGLSFLLTASCVLSVLWIVILLVWCGIIANKEKCRRIFKEKYIIATFTICVVYPLIILGVIS